MSNLGQHWLLLRGLGRESAHWGEFKSLMQAHFMPADIHSLDLIGAGDLYESISPDNVAQITAQLRERAAQLGLLTQPITLCAVSFGAMVAWHWLKTYPQDCAGACLINTSFANLSPFYQRLRWQNLPQLLRIIMTRNIAKREAAIIHLVANNRDNDQKTTALWISIQQRRPIHYQTVLKQLIAAARFDSGNKPDKPILILSTQGDKLVSPRCSLAIAQHYQLNCVVHSWAGHDLSSDDPHWVIEQLTKWLTSNN